MRSTLGWFTYNPYKNKTMFMYIFLASFRSQETQRQRRQERQQTIGFMSKTTVSFTHRTFLMSIVRWEVLWTM